MQSSSSRTRKKLLDMPTDLPITCHICFRQEPLSGIERGWLGAGPQDGGWEGVRYGFCPDCLKKRGLEPRVLPRSARPTEADLLAAHHKQITQMYLCLMLVAFAFGLMLGDIEGSYSERILHPCSQEPHAH